MEAIQPLQSSSSSSLHQQIQNHNQYQQQIQPSDSDPTAGELRALDCNLASLCDHVQNEGFHSGAFSDVIVEAMGSTYPLHRLILSRSSYFRNMLYGPWKEAGAPTIVLSIDDANVNSKSIEMALAYLYGHHPKLNDDNAFRVLAAASFLDLQDLCAICTDFIISELWTSNFLAYQVFAEGQDYGIHGERVRNACWGYLCQSGTMELREVLPKLSSQTLHALLTSDELWVPNEEKRFELALYALLAKAALSEANQAEIGSMSSEMSERNLSDAHGAQKIESESHRIGVQYNFDGHKASHNIPVELADCVVDSHSNSISVPIRQPASSQPMLDSDANRASCTYLDSHIEGPSDENMCYHQNNNNNDDCSNTWIHRDQLTEASSTSGVTYNDWGKCNMQPLWGGRIVGRRQIKNTKGNLGMQDDEYDSFISIFEGGSLLYCNMSFEALLNVRKQLEELGFPCKAVNDGLWLQMLLCQKVQEVAANTCRNCCLTRCACRQSYGCSSKGGAHVGYYRQEHDRNNMNNANMGNIYVDDPQGDGGGAFVPAARLHVRGPIDGLAGIGRGNAYVANAAWPPTRYVFSRVPFGLGARNGQQQSVANDESEPRVDINGDLSGDGLTALVNLSQGSNIGSRMNAEQSDRINEQDLHGRFSSACGISMQMMEPHENSTSGLEWGNSEDSSILLDTKTPLRDFPPFRFGIEFDEVHRLVDGQVKHSPEVFYAGSLWKVSVQAFNDEDPQGRRTLGLFLHRRKAEINDSFRKIHTYVDTREKVTARYQLICPSKREVMVFGSFKQAGTQLPKAPKGWGWRTALLFDELGELLQGGTLRIAAVVQLV